MDRLIDYLVSYTRLTKAEIHRACLRHPRCSVLQALKQDLRDELYKDVLCSVVKGNKIQLLTDKDLFGADPELFRSDSAALIRLVERLGAFPVRWSTADARQTLVLAVCDPFTSYAGSVFSAYYQAPVQLCLAEESAIRAALLHVVGTGANLDPMNGMDRVQPLRPVFPGETEDTVQFVEEWLIGLAQQNVTGIECGFFKDTVQVALQYPDNRISATALAVDHNAFMRVILNRTDRRTAAGNLFSGTLRADSGQARVTAAVAFQQSIATRVMARHNVLQIGDIEVNAWEREPYWLSEPQVTVQQFRQLLDKEPGYYVVAVADIASYRLLRSSFLKSHPDLYIMDRIDTAFNINWLREHAAYARVLVPVRLPGIPDTLHHLEALTPEQRSAVRAVISFGRVPAACPFCLVECPPARPALKNVSLEIPTTITSLRYPRGCPVCLETGYVGWLSATTVLSMDTPAGDAFSSGFSTRQVLPLLSRSGLVPVARRFVERAFAGETTVEMVLRAACNREDITENACLAPDASELTEKGAPELVPLKESPLLMKPLQKTEPWVHSVVLKLDADLEDARPALLREEHPVSRDPSNHQVDHSPSVKSAAFNCAP